MKRVLLTAAAMALGFCAHSASAQLPRLGAGEEKALLCISDSFSADDTAAVAQAEIRGDQTSATAAATAMLKGRTACKGLLRDDQRRIEIAENIAIAQAIIDIAVAQLAADGMKSGGGLYAVWSGLGAEDQSYFLDEQAPSDEAFRARIKPLLVTAGTPADDRDVDGAMLVMQCLSNIAVYYRQWLRLDTETRAR